jgi:NADH-quinone oxidoreductase subunit H
MHALSQWFGDHPMAQELVITSVKVMVIQQALLLVFSLMTWVERRLLALMQFRLGPNRTGPFGILQPIADGIKLFFKEELIPEGANKLVFVAAPAVAVFTAFLAVAVVPYGPPIVMPHWGFLAPWLQGRVIPLQIADLDVGVLFLFAISSLSVYAIVMAGWASNNKFTLLGGLRSSAQMFSYELALGLSWVGLIMLAGSFKITDIVASQAGGFWNWNLWPWRQGVAFLIYLVAQTAEVNRTPFDLPEAETELVAGFHTEYSSMRFALLQMAEYVNMITACVVGSHLFLGGWLSPFPPGVPFLGAGSPLWFFAKVGMALFFFVWLRGTVPRFRYDQLMHFGWKVLVPAGTINILLIAAAVVLFQ